MLAPTERRLLLEALRPPDGFTFDEAVATTFTLDLVTLMTVPLAFHLYDVEDDEGRPVVDPVALLDSLRQSAGKLSVFCDAGHISVPAVQQCLFALLEDAVVEVSARRPGGCFHPKLWVIRYVAGSDVRYRVLCASRNLTGDRSWDVLLALEGPLVDRKVAYAVNHRLADFVSELPNLARRPTEPRVSKRIALFASELRRVNFELPDSFDAMTFWPLGTGRSANPYDRDDTRRLIISPFISDGALARLLTTGGNDVLVSRVESMAACQKETLKRFGKVYALAPSADAETDVESEEALTGLHAKVVVGDHGWNSSVWVGSANATDAALNANVEFVVELEGKKSQVGVDATLAGLQSLLTAVDIEALAPAAVEEEFVGVMERQLELLAAHDLRVVVSQEAGVLVQAVATATPIAVDERVAVTCWPVTLPQPTHERALTAGPGTVASFTPMSPDSVTAFVAFQISAGGTTVPKRFVRALPIEGVPDDRIQRVLRSVLANKEQVLRMLLLLLSGDQALLEVAGQGDGAAIGAAEWLLQDATVMEALLRALHEAPARLDRVHGIVSELLNGPEGRGVLPDGFERVWAPVWKARQELGRG